MKRLLNTVLFLGLLVELQGQNDPTLKAFSECANDSIYAMAHSIEAIYTVDFSMQYLDETAPPHMRDLLMSPLGKTAGPVIENGHKAYYKSISADSILSFHTAHIIVTHAMHSPGEAQQLIEEAYAKLKSNVPWTKVVDEYSEDGTVERDGDLDWADETMFVPSYTAVCRTMKKDDMRIVETEFGWHIVWMKSTPRKARSKVTCLRMATK